MIRVTHVITRMIRGGAQQVVRHLVEGMDPSRFESDVVCGDQDATMLGHFKNVTVMPQLVREVSPRRDARALVSLFQRFRRKPHIVHGHTYKAGVLASIAARKAGVPAVIFTPHGHIFNSDAKIPGVPRDRRLGILKMVTRYAQACAHAVTALSEQDLQEQLSHGLSPRSKYRVIRNGIDIGRYSNGQRIRGRSRLVIGSVGRLTEEKGHRYLVGVLKYLPEATMAIVGDGPERDKIELEAHRQGVGNRIEMLGELDSDQFLPELDVYIQPSLYESQGLAILEAMAAGIPVVATRVGGVAGVVNDGVTGLLVPPADPKALADAVKRILKEKEKTREMIRAARAEVARDWSVGRMVGEYERLYLQLLRR